MAKGRNRKPLLPVLELTNSSRSCFLECPRKYYWAYHHRFNRGSSGGSYALTLGSGFHEGVAAAYLTRADGNEDLAVAKEVAAGVCEVFFSTQLADPDAIAEYQLVEAETLCAALLEKYLNHWWERDVKDYDIILVEEAVRHRLIDSNVELRGKIDLVVRDREGATWIVDHKTTSRYDKTYAAAIQVDTQLLRYGLVYSATTGESVAGVVYDVVVKPKRMAANQTPEQYATTLDATTVQFVRIKVEQSEAFANEMFHDDVAVGHMIERCASTGVWPKNAPAACGGRYSFGMGCPFIQLCTLGVPLGDAEMYGFMQRDVAHPELDGGVNA